jgi:hypothetical protein
VVETSGLILEVREMITGLVRKPERILPFTRSRVIWRNNIKINVKRIQFEVDDQIHLAQRVIEHEALVKAGISFLFSKEIFLP